MYVHVLYDQTYRDIFAPLIGRMRSGVLVLKEEGTQVETSVQSPDSVSADRADQVA